jgi:hypothetical protein
MTPTWGTEVSIKKKRTPKEKGTEPITKGRLITFSWVSGSLGPRKNDKRLRSLGSCLDLWIQDSPCRITLAQHKTGRLNHSGNVFPDEYAKHTQQIQDESFIRSKRPGVYAFDYGCLLIRDCLSH